MKSGSLTEERIIRAVGGPGAPARAPERSRAETHRRLVAAGTDLFARRGLFRTTTTQIAQAAGVAAGTFYLHFRDKQALFAAIAADAARRLRERMERAGRAAGDPQARVRASGEALLGFAEENRSLIRVLFGRGHEAGALGDEFVDALVPDVELRLGERIAAGLTDPGLHPGVGAQALAGMWVRAVTWWLEDPSRAPREAVLETLVRLHPVTRARDGRPGAGGGPAAAEMRGDAEEA